jgi:quinol monooxygenase YgiN
MYVSEIHFQFEPESFERINSLAGGVVERLRQVPGCRQVLVLRTAQDQLTSLVTYDTRVQAEAATPTIASFFAQVAPLLTVMPQREIYPALIFEQFVR